MIKTNANSKNYDVVCNWERRKELSIIGNDCFKFKVNIIYENNNYKKNVSAKWTVDIFCVHEDYLISNNSDSSKYEDENYNDDREKKYRKHFFENCDCHYGYDKCKYKLNNEEYEEWMLLYRQDVECSDLDI